MVYNYDELFLKIIKNYKVEMKSDIFIRDNVMLF